MHELLLKLPSVILTVCDAACLHILVIHIGTAHILLPPFYPHQGRWRSPFSHLARQIQSIPCLRTCAQSNFLRCQVTQHIQVLHRKIRMIRVHGLQFEDSLDSASLLIQHITENTRINGVAAPKREPQSATVMLDMESALRSHTRTHARTFTPANTRTLLQLSHNHAHARLPPR